MTTRKRIAHVLTVCAALVFFFTGAALYGQEVFTNGNFTVIVSNMKPQVGEEVTITAELNVNTSMKNVFLTYGSYDSSFIKIIAGNIRYKGPVKTGDIIRQTLVVSFIEAKAISIAFVGGQFLTKGNPVSLTFFVGGAFYECREARDLRYNIRLLEKILSDPTMAKEETAIEANNLKVLKIQKYEDEFNADNASRKTYQPHNLRNLSKTELNDLKKKNEDLIKALKKKHEDLQLKLKNLLRSGKRNKPEDGMSLQQSQYYIHVINGTTTSAFWIYDYDFFRAVDADWTVSPPYLGTITEITEAGGSQYMAAFFVRSSNYRSV